MATGALVTAAALGAIVTGFSAQRQAEAGRRAETRARSVARIEAERQRRQEQIIATQERDRAQQVGARLKATAGRRAGRRSLLFGGETGVSQLGQQEQLG